MHMTHETTRFLAVFSSLASLLLVGSPAPGLADLPIDRQHLRWIEPLVTVAIDRGDMPGCVVAIGRRDGIAFLEAFGNRQLEPEPAAMTTDTVFDLASLTKPIATATSIMQLVERGQIRLREKLTAYHPRFANGGKEAIIIEQLLTHSAGLIPDNPLGDYEHGAEEAWRRIDALKVESEPGSEFAYTDVGFLLLGRLVSEVTGQPLDEYVRQQIYEPLGMDETGYLPAESLRSRAAPTTKQDGHWLQGEVHDPRAARLGGVAGHAGLFSTAEDLSRYARMMLGRGELDGVRVLSPATIEQMTQPRLVGLQQRGLGWDSRSGYSSNRGELMSDAAFGHGGFTGTGIWIDPEIDLFVIFLSNRLHPDEVGTVNDLIGRIGAIAAAAAR